MNFRFFVCFGILTLAISNVHDAFASADSSEITQNSTQSGIFKNSKVKVVPSLGLITHGYRESNKSDFSQSAFQLGLKASYHFDDNWHLASFFATTTAAQTREGEQTARFIKGVIQVEQESFGWSGPLDATFGGGLYYSSMSRTSSGEGYGRIAAPEVSAQFRRHVKGAHSVGLGSQFVSIFKNAADLSFPGYRASIELKYFFQIPNLNEIAFGLEGATQKFDRGETTYRENDVALNLSYPL